MSNKEKLTKLTIPLLLLLSFSSCKKNVVKTEGDGLSCPIDIVYQGAFRLPEGRTQINDTIFGSFQASAAAACYNSVNNSLFFAARAESKNYRVLFPLIAEVKIPEPKIDKVKQLPVAQIKTQYTDCISGVIKKIQEKYEKGERHGIGGLMAMGEHLYGTIYRWHNCGEMIPVSHFYTKRSGFSKNNTVGLLSIQENTINGINAPEEAMAGYMSPIPEAYKTLFGYDALTGSLHGSEIGGRLSRCSSGPAAFGFNPGDFLNSKQIKGEQFLFHPLDKPMDEKFYHKSHDINGMAFVSLKKGDKKESFIIYAFTYGNAPYHWDSGYKANSYDAVLFFYKPEDLLEVKAGKKKQYELKPIGKKIISKDFYSSAHRIKSMAYNPDKNLLYIVEDQGNDPYPVVHVYQLK